MRPDLDALARAIDAATTTAPDAILDAWCRKVDELTAQGVDDFNALCAADNIYRDALQRSLDRD